MRARRQKRSISSFQKIAGVKERHVSVLDHEEEAAKIFGGERHRGSGALTGLKSDASSKDFQIECKQTEKESMRLELKWLEKITNEAVGKQKIPALHIRFTECRNVAAKDWVMVPAFHWEKYVCRFSEEPN